MIASASYLRQARLGRRVISALNVADARPHRRPHRTRVPPKPASRL
jgi:hypothetical protein